MSKFKVGDKVFVNGVRKGVGEHYYGTVGPVAVWEELKTELEVARVYGKISVGVSDGENYGIFHKDELDSVGECGVEKNLKEVKLAWAKGDTVQCWTPSGWRDHPSRISSI